MSECECDLSGESPDSVENKSRTCPHDHDTRDNATWYGGTPGHDYYHCDGCGARITVVVG